MKLTFVTGNKNKFLEAKEIIPELIQSDIDLPEIQELDPQKVIEYKLNSIKDLDGSGLIVEDNSLVLEGMNGLPGPLIKWFLKSVGIEGIVKLTEVYGNKAKASVTIGYKDANKNISFFKGEVAGMIVASRGDKGFGWDPIFQPDNSDKTFGEMELEEKNKYSMRAIAFQALKTSIENN